MSFEALRVDFRLENVGDALPMAAVLEDGGIDWVKSIIFLLVFVGPAILNAIKESARKRKAAEARRLGREPEPEPAAQADESEDETEADRREEPQPMVHAETVESPNREGFGDSGRGEWERLLRGESAPDLPPPVPPPGHERPVARRRVLTETAPMTESAPLTDVRVPEVATEGRSLEGASYDRLSGDRGAGRAGPGGLSRDFAEFAPPPSMGSNAAGSMASTLADRPMLDGAPGLAAFPSASGTAGVDLQRGEIGRTDAFAQGAASPSTGPGSRRRFARAELRRAILAAEILGAPLATRPADQGPTRPLSLT